MKNKTIRTILSTLLLFSVLTTLTSSCNSKDEDEPGYTPSSSVAITGFKLKPNKNVMLNLDSVFFSIDLEHGIIYNADSLPMGTPVTKLIPVITYPTECSAATIRMTNGAHKQGEINYKENPNDTIDFSGDVTFTLTAQNGIDFRTYRLKVNVHKVKPDSLCFDKQAVSSLPSRLPNPKNQKTVQYRNGVLSMIQENDNSWTIATSSSTAQWIKTAVSPIFNPDLRSLTVTDDILYILDDNGAMYKSNDGIAWMSIGKSWHKILGAYGNDLLGIKSENGKYFHTSLSGKFPETEVAENFPINMSSNMLCLTSKFAIDPIGFITGGLSADGSAVNGTWGFDGHSWTQISNNPCPALTDPVVAPYFVYKQTSASWIQTEFPVMILFGGKLADGSLNNKTYITIDNGVNWVQAPANLSLPDIIPATTQADVAILSFPMQGNLADAWKDTPNKIRQRLNYKVEGYDISWECPYLYIFGGIDNEGKLNDIVWRGVLARLTFMPLI
ncbi:MAG: DUF6242 domain-containing protein [Prevotella sp.]|nr:DUF6242 domain-containing protein [Bacteroides sp.]MCM1366833.1 DUF6242 domain-containing protein [Prevotella sp.]MCM1437183.1 DUF6242 domain-containing protein [Prevotella sp.]